MLFGYNQKKTVVALSERIKTNFRSENLFKKHISPDINWSNIQNNISGVLADLILNLEFVQRTTQSFEDVIKAYCKGRNSRCSISCFLT